MSKPPIFSNLSLHEARLQANASGKLLLIDVGAEWCPPCKNMDKTTWVDTAVVEWVNQNAVAVQFDGDEHRHIVETFGIRAFPTIILERDDNELDRTTGGRNGVDLLRWLESARSGRTELDSLLANENPSSHDRFTRAKMLMRAGRDDEALNDFVWLWEQSRTIDPAWFSERNSSLVAALTTLVERSALARERVRQLRDAVATRRAEPGGFEDWVTLSALLEETDDVVNWLADITPTLVEQLGVHRDRHVFRVLAERNQFALLGGLLRDASELFENEFKEMQRAMADPHPGYPPEIAEDSRKFVMNWQRRRTQQMRQALLAAGRTDDANVLVATALRLDNTDEMKRALESQ